MLKLTARSSGRCWDSLLVVIGTALAMQRGFQHEMVSFDGCEISCCRVLFLGKDIFVDIVGTESHDKIGTWWVSEGA